MPSRRRVLAAAATVLSSLGGCATLDTSNASGIVLRFDPVPASAVGSADLLTAEEFTAPQRHVVDAGVPNGAAAYGHPPIGAGAFVLDNGTYYAVAASGNGTETVTRPVLSADPAAEAGGSTVEFGDLSRTDQRTLKCAVTDGKEPTPCVLYAGTESAFWPDPGYARVGGDAYRLSIAERNVTLDRYDYEFEPVARNRSAFADYAARNALAANYDEMPLSEEQRSILRTAANDGVYRETPPYSDAIRTVVEVFRQGADGNEDYVRFAGSFYLASVRQVYDD